MPPHHKVVVIVKRRKQLRKADRKPMPVVGEYKISTGDTI
jgi:hypothetical protein